MRSGSPRSLERAAIEAAIESIFDRSRFKGGSFDIGEAREASPIRRSHFRSISARRTPSSTGRPRSRSVYSGQPLKGWPLEGVLQVTWNTSNRSSRLPADWPAIRRLVLQDAGYRCQIRLTGCSGQASEVDHRRRGDDHSRANLRAACSGCHGKKSSAEGNARRAELRARRKRPQERHPGSI